jgi:two-component system response regulator PilR (NtrC family)
MSKQYALVIDDERDIRELLTLTLGRMGLLVESAATVSEARQRLAERRYALCFTDMRLPDGTGHEVIELFASQYPETPVAMITAYGNVDAAVVALKAHSTLFPSRSTSMSCAVCADRLAPVRGKEVTGEQHQADRRIRADGAIACNDCQGRAARHRCMSPANPASARSWPRA